MSLEIKLFLCVHDKFNYEKSPCGVCNELYSSTHIAMCFCGAIARKKFQFRNSKSTCYNKVFREV